jgi:hypothetical protein
MKTFSILLCGIFLLAITSSLEAGELILYRASLDTGRLKFSSIPEIPENLLDKQSGKTFGMRLSSGKKVCYEQNISYSPRFARPGVKAFQMDSNLVLQAPGRVVPYVTAGIGFIVTWGQDLTDDLQPEELAAAAFSMGRNFSLNYGGGIKLRRIAGPVGFNFDLRGYTLPGAREGSLNFRQMSFGVAFTW